jgi:hypothetical protein
VELGVLYGKVRGGQIPGSVGFCFALLFTYVWFCYFIASRKSRQASRQAGRQDKDEFLLRSCSILYLGSEN